ncbi:MAG: hypothetical protein FJ037_04925 [Chloroflexi bacterium]|nr:hypothetical protein [Chloroflexota bacterium]
MSLILLMGGGVGAVVGNWAFAPVAAVPGLVLAGGAALIALRCAIARRERVSQLETWMSAVSRELPDMLFEISPDGRFIGVTFASSEILGRTPEDLVGTSWRRSSSTRSRS